MAPLRKKIYIRAGEGGLDAEKTKCGQAAGTTKPEVWNGRKMKSIGRGPAQSSGEGWKSEKIGGSGLLGGKVLDFFA